MAAQRRPRTGQRPATTRRSVPKTTSRSAARTTPPPASHTIQPASTVAPSGIVSPWGRVDEEFAMIRSDLRRLLVLTALIMAILIVLTFFLR